MPTPTQLQSFFKKTLKMLPNLLITNPKKINNYLKKIYITIKLAV